MSQEQWSEVDRYIKELFVPPDPALDDAMQDSEAAGLPAISVTPSQGKLLFILARAIGARSILEIGTLGGYSTIWLARGLAPGGRLFTLEADPKHAAVARANLARAHLDDAVQVRVGPALETLPQLAARGVGPFDLVFIDADKRNNSAYFEWALRLSHRGTLIIVDNVVRRVALYDEDSEDEDVIGTREFNAALAAEPRVHATIIQTVGSKGYDGFAIAVVR